MLPMLFVGTGLLLVKLRKHALHANECYDFEQQELEAAKAASLKTCCGCAAEDGELELTTDEDKAKEELTCKYCDEDASCRFCFAGPEKGELIAPCACVGSQELVHTACLKQWQKIAMRTKGNRETTCRVCHAEFRIPGRLTINQRFRLWFSFKAKDRLNEYSRVWLQTLFELYMAHKKGVGLVRGAGVLALGAASSSASSSVLSSSSSSSSSAKSLVRSSSAQDLAVMVASTEVRIWAGREVRHGKTGPYLVKAMTLFGSTVNILSRMKAIGVF